MLNDTSTAGFKVREKKRDVPEDMNMGGMSRFCWDAAQIVCDGGGGENISG